MKKVVIMVIVCCLMILSLTIASCKKETATTTTTATQTTTTTATQTATTTATQTATTSAQQQYGGILKLGAGYDGVNIGYPAKSARVAASWESAPAIETLLRIDSSGKLIPWLATDYKEDAAAKTITLTLRQGVKFHDDTDFDADAAKWNLDQCISQKTAGTDKFTSVDVINSNTIRINLSVWDTTLTGNLARTIGQMISPTACQTNGVDWASNNPIGTGPFKFVNWDKDVKCVYTKFDGYWQEGKPYLDGVEYIVIVDNTTRVTSFRAGELDLLFQTPQNEVGSLTKDYVVLKTAGGSGANSLVPNSANPDSPWANIKVRQAAQYALDTQSLVDALIFGLGEPANQWIYKGHWAYNPSVVGYPYNVTKAKELLNEAGYSEGFDTTITFPIGASATYAAIQDQFKAVNINAQLNEIQTAAFDPLVFGGSWDGLLMGIASTNPDVVAELNRLFSGKAYTAMIAPDDYVQAIQKAITAADFATKQKMAQEAMSLMFDKYCLINPLWCGLNIGITQTYLKDSGLCSTPNMGFWTPEDARFNK